MSGAEWVQRHSGFPRFLRWLSESTAREWDECTFDMPEVTEDFDPNALSRLRDLSDANGSIAPQIIAIFEREWPTRMTAIQAALQSGASKDAGREAHSLASTCGVLGGRAARRDALALERAIASENRDSVRELFSTLQTSLQSLTSELRRLNLAPPAGDP